MNKEKFWGCLLARLDGGARSPEDVGKIVTLVMTALDYATEETEE